MEKISLNLNVNSVAVLLNGFVGEILISVNRVIRNNAVEIMLANTQKSNYQNARDREHVR